MALPKTFGWSPSPYDARDALYAYAPRRSSLTLPSKFRIDDGINKEPWLPAWNQGNIGSCGPHTLAANIVFADLHDGDNAADMPSRLFLYWVTRYLMGTVNQDSGVNNRVMLKALAQFGWCPEKLHPYNVNEFKTKPSNAVFSAAIARKPNIVYRAVAQNLDVMRTCLFETKRPIIFGFMVYANIDLADRTGDIPMPRGAVQGGHDVLLVGYDDTKQVFHLRNSWGPTWGNNGFGTIPYAFAANPQLASDFWTVEKATPDVTPQPIPDPTPIPDPQPTPPGETMLSKILALIAAIRSGDYKAVLTIILQLLEEFNKLSPSELAELDTELKAFQALSAVAAIKK